MKIICFCTLYTGLLSLDLALKLGVKIERVIGLNPKSVNDLDKISGFIDITSFCKKNKLDFKLVDDYSLKSESPSYVLKKNDLIWITGWQRLLPQSFIKYPNVGVVGSHGSCDGILKGRGRSPQNWSLLMGKKKFKISMFKITKNIDSGKVIITKEFKYNQNDNIFHSYLKVSKFNADSIHQITINPNLIKKSKKQNGKPQYFPKRIPEDGFIDWSMSAIDIFNQIKSLSKPYPNARTLIKNEIMFINKASSLDIQFDKGYGKILHLYSNGYILVSCGKGSLLIEDYIIKNKKLITINSLFKSVPMKGTVNKIIKRFKQDFPNKKINSSLLSFWRKRKYI